MVGVWPWMSAVKGSANFGLGNTIPKQGRRPGKLNLGKREKCGPGLASLSAGFPHQSLCEGLALCQLCPRWSRPGPKGIPWSNHCVG